MNGGLRAMLEGVIDYAGLFPPAKLPMPEALHDYLGILGSADRWVVDRFACPAGKLRDLSVELAQNPEGALVPVTVIGSVQPDHKHWRHGIEHDAVEMLNFQRSAEANAEIQAYEVRVPDHQHVAEYVGDLKSFTNVDVFVELPWEPDMANSLAVIAESESACAKARTGGLEASAFPSAGDLASFIQQCVQLDLGFKLTAGLHHPLPTRDPETGAMMHGFLNVLTATTLTLAEDLSKREIEVILQETDPKAISFRRESLVWNGHKAGLEAIENARTLFFSFGSCSVAEPLKGLEELGLLEGATR